MQISIINNLLFVVIEIFHDECNIIVYYVMCKLNLKVSKPIFDSLLLSLESENKHNSKIHCNSDYNKV